MSIFYLFFIITGIFACRKFHNITYGDTCVRISKKYSISVQQLIVFNQDLNCNNINQFDKLCVDNQVYERPLISTCTRSYIVTSGDSCDEISSRYGIDIRRFLMLNPNIDCFFLSRYVGQTVCLNSTCLLYYELGEEESCAVLAEKFNVTVEQLLIWNSNNIDCEHMGFSRLCVKKNVDEASKCTKYYETTLSDVYVGDILRKFGLTFQKLKELNPGLKSIRVSQTLCVQDDQDNKI